MTNKFKIIFGAILATVIIAVVMVALNTSSPKDTELSANELPPTTTNPITKDTPTNPNAQTSKTQSQATTQNKSALDNLPPALSPIADEKLSIGKRFAAVKSAGRNPSPETIKQLLDITNAPDLTPSVRNEICNVLVRGNNPEAITELAQHLSTMLTGPAHTPLWRGYCTQHLRELYLQHRELAALKSLRSAAREITEPKVQAAGLYSLCLLSSEIGWSKSATTTEAKAVMAEITTLLNAALDAKQNIDLRTNAVRSACAADRHEYIQEFQKILSNTTEPIQLRNACAAVLGEFRDASSIPALKGVLNSDSKRLVKTATRSLGKIKAATKADK